MSEEVNKKKSQKMATQKMLIMYLLFLVTQYTTVKHCGYFRIPMNLYKCKCTWEHMHLRYTYNKYTERNIESVFLFVHVYVSNTNKHLMKTSI